jgi:phosphoglycolate phosphatase-like HAD superfamily hydrolase
MHLLFDLDETLADSFRNGRSIDQTLTNLGREAVPIERLRRSVDARLPAIFFPRRSQRVQPGHRLDPVATDGTSPRPGRIA